eukprot:CAMPEP_0119108926 /NCGR_PEP_ID=MMETSP1180-20130426/16208_1 /TAXON_ID=3052 ORGANISM="Chlamydomonas cf sp, Strain CCMP681" /NCGR_SAMPLE_ID=MMETSP1180 /ASSEMBLY_ACC=CAM_ASM_000741 /LENGTH=98 /DNA_ID=CAMNT_0007094605 /DNA_START=103 /DNA_END=399 /DNA_ORIENTATION=-
MPLNPNAASFTPQHVMACPTYYTDEASVSWEELLELEEVDQWVGLMADLEALETEHLIAYALQLHCGPGTPYEEEKIKDISAAAQAMSGNRQQKSGSK